MEVEIQKATKNQLKEGKVASSAVWRDVGARGSGGSGDPGGPGVREVHAFMDCLV